MLKLRRSFESLLFRIFYLAGSSELDMLSKYTSSSCLARGTDPTTAWQESPKFLPAYDRVEGPLHKNKSSSGEIKNHVLTYIRASPHSLIRVVVSPDCIAV